MSWDIGINFRATSGYVTDGSNEVPWLGEAYSTNKTNGDGLSVTAGWSSSITSQSRDRDSSLDRRLAGINYANVTSLYFRLDLPSAGDYDVHLAIGDYGANNSGDWILKDQTTTLATFSAGITDYRYFKDATDVNRMYNVWAANEVKITKTFATTELRFYCNSTNTNVLAHMRVVQVGGAAAATHFLGLLGIGG